jgi:pyruvate/2-oxoglutarate/acetoin dehydrogenase E1 component
VFCEPIRLYRSIKEEVPEIYYKVDIGPLRVEREGDDVTLISWGAMLKETRQAASAPRRVRSVGGGPRSADPLPTRSRRHSQQCRQDRPGGGGPRGAATAGFGAEVVATIQESCLFSLLAPVRRVTGWDTVFPLKRGEHHYLPSVERIAAAAESTLEDQ